MMGIETTVVRFRGVVFRYSTVSCTVVVLVAVLPLVAFTVMV